MDLNIDLNEHLTKTSMKTSLIIEISDYSIKLYRKLWLMAKSISNQFFELIFWRRYFLETINHLQFVPIWVLSQISYSHKETWMEASYLTWTKVLLLLRANWSNFLKKILTMICKHCTNIFVFINKLPMAEECRWCRLLLLLLSQKWFSGANNARHQHVAN